MSLTQSDIEKIKELYATLDNAVNTLEASKPWLNEFARRVASGDSHVPGLMSLLFKVAGDPLSSLLSADSFQDFASGLSERESTAQILHNESDWSDKSIRTLQRDFVRLRRTGVVLSRTKGKWGERGSRPSDYGRTAYRYRLNPLSRGPATINYEVQKIDRDFLTVAEKFLVRLPGYRELLARALSVTFELASNPDFLAILWQIPMFKGLFDEIDVGMIEHLGKQLSLLIPAELVPISLVRQRLPVIGDIFPWDEAKRLRLEIDLG
jgi:DNA-binding transcriptional ArsR family regulator